MLYKVVLTLNLWMKSYDVTIQMKATEQYFPVVLFIILYKVVLTFKSVDEILQCNLSNKSYWAVLLCGTAYYGVKGVFIFWDFGQNHTVWPIKWNPFILQYETRNFSWTSRGTKSTFKIEPCPIKVHRMFSFWGAEEGGARETMVTNEWQKKQLSDIWFTAYISMPSDSQYHKPWRRFLSGPT